MEQGPVPAAQREEEERGDTLTPMLNVWGREKGTRRPQVFSISRASDALSCKLGFLPWYLFRWAKGHHTKAGVELPGLQGASSLCAECKGLHPSLMVTFGLSHWIPS